MYASRDRPYEQEFAGYFIKCCYFPWLGKLPYFSLLTFHISQSQAHVEDLNEVERNLEERNKVCKEIESQRVLAEKRYGIPSLPHPIR